MAKNKKDNSETPKGSKNRDAGTGKYVSKSYADKHPKTTLNESVDKKKAKGTDHTGPRRKK
ncbi:MAG: hypothetical protein ABI851_15330 [Saprospiraceae bacterium]